MDYLDKKNDFAESTPEEPCFSDVPKNSGGQAEENDHEVSTSKVDDVDIGDCPHGGVLVNGHAHKHIAKEPDDENNRMQDDENPLIRHGEYVLFNHGYVVFVWHAIIVWAVLRHRNVPTGLCQ